MSPRDRRRSDGERGAVAILVAVLFVVLLGFLALVVDVGRLLRTRGQLQNASDAAALAAAQELDRTEEGLIRARDAAKWYAAKHWAHDGEVAIDDDDVIFGAWDAAERVFTALGAFPDDPSAVNAVQVIDRREQATGNPIPFFFAQFVTGPSGDVNSQAVAVGGGPATECGFPLVVSDCALKDTLEDGSCEYCIKFQADKTDNAGWTTFDDSNGVTKIADKVKQACYDDAGKVAIDPETGQCAGRCVDVGAGDEVKVYNGNGFNKNDHCAVLEDILRRGNKSKNAAAKSFLVTVPVLESDPGTCSADKFAGTHPIAGFATMEIFGVKCGNCGIL